MQILNDTGLIRLLQISGEGFPVSSARHSFGAENLIIGNQITDAESFMQLTRTLLNDAISGCDAPMIALAYDCAVSEDYESLLRLDEGYASLNMTRELYEEQIKTGRAFLRIAAQMFPDDVMITRIENYTRKKGGSYPVAFGMVCARLNAGKGTSVMAYIYSALNSIVQTGVKLVPLGTIEGQRILYSLHADIIEYSRKALTQSMGQLPSKKANAEILPRRHFTVLSEMYMS